MKESKNQVKESILFFARKFELEKSYEEIIKFESLPELVKMIVYDMFLSGFVPSNIEESLSHKVIFDYARELKQNGYVEFDEK